MHPIPGIVGLVYGSVEQLEEAPCGSKSLILYDGNKTLLKKGDKLNLTMSVNGNAQLVKDVSGTFVYMG